MKAYRFDSFDSLEALRLREEADPVPQRGEVLVRVHAVSLNYRDLAMLRGRYPRKCVPGHVPTSDAAGEPRSCTRASSSSRNSASSSGRASKLPLNR